MSRPVAPGAGKLANQPIPGRKASWNQGAGPGTVVARSPRESMMRRLLPLLFLLLVPALARASDDAVADKARVALEAERRLAHETDPATRENLRREVRRADADARSAAREDLRSGDRAQHDRIDRADRRDVRVIGGHELSREHEHGSSGREERTRERSRDEERVDRDRERDREHEHEREDDHSESTSHDDGSSGTGDDHGDGGSEPH